VSTAEARDLRLRVRRLVVDAAVLEHAGLGGAAFSRHLQDALRDRALGATSATGAVPARVAQAVGPVADASGRSCKAAPGRGRDESHRRRAATRRRHGRRRPAAAAAAPLCRLRRQAKPGHDECEGCKATRVQRRLAVGASDDRYEHEADAAARA
jgi:hypothetical protein